MGGMVAGGGVGAVVLALVAALFGVDLSSVVPTEQTQAPAGQQQGPRPDDPRADSVSRMLRSTEVVWNGIFQEMGQRYQEPRLVLFERGVSSACGFAQSGVGPFYCPGDQKVYIDLAFYDDLARRFGAPGDVAQAYVIAHEVGHHVQNLVGTSAQVEQAQRAARSRAEANQYSVMLELQADCYAGVWANRAQAAGAIALEPGEIEEALTAASAIGDDRLQAQAQGHVVPESFTHGSSAQRVRWFQRGFESGDPNQCNTFEARQL